MTAEEFLLKVAADAGHFYIVSSATCSVDELAVARAEDRFLVVCPPGNVKFGLGFVIRRGAMKL